MDTMRIVHMNLSALIYRHNMFQLLYVSVQFSSASLHVHSSNCMTSPRKIYIGFSCWFSIGIPYIFLVLGRKSVGIPWKIKRKNQESHGDDMRCVRCEMKVAPKKQTIVTSKQKNILRRSKAKKRLVWTLLC